MGQVANPKIAQLTDVPKPYLLVQWIWSGACRARRAGGGAEALPRPSSLVAYDLNPMQRLSTRSTFYRC